MKKAFKQYAEVAPFLLLGFVSAIVFVFYPMVKGIYMSFYNYNIISPSHSSFVGLENYVHLFKDPKFYLSLRNTLLMTLITVPGQWFFGILVALAIHLKFVRFKIGFRLIYYIPVITSWIVVSYLFKFIFADGSDGIMNYLLIHLHILSEPINWLQNTWTANVVIWIVSIWKGIGWVMIMYLASLQSIPASLYEAAAIDGAKGAKTFAYITLPLMKPMTTYVLINLVIGSFQAFIQIFLITDGGPLGTTEVLNTYMFKHAFQYFEFGYASAVGLVVGLLIFIITYGQQRKFGQERIEY